MTTIDRGALEIALQAGGEMFGRTVFNTGNLSPEVEWPSDEAEEEPVLAAIELGDLSRLLSKAVSETLSPFEGRRIGFALSGGVDSSMLLFLVKRAMPDLDVVAYHSDWDYPPKSELRYAEMAASFADVPLKVIDVSPARQLPHLDDALTKVRNISYSTPPVYMVFEEMANDDVEVAVNAQGLRVGNETESLSLIIALMEGVSCEQFV